MPHFLLGAMWLPGFIPGFTVVNRNKGIQPLDNSWLAQRDSHVIGSPLPWRRGDRGRPQTACLFSLLVSGIDCSACILYGRCKHMALTHTSPHPLLIWPPFYSSGTQTLGGRFWPSSVVQLKSWGSRVSTNGAHSQQALALSSFQFKRDRYLDGLGGGVLLCSHNTHSFASKYKVARWLQIWTNLCLWHVILEWNMISFMLLHSECMRGGGVCGGAWMCLKV